MDTMTTVEAVEKTPSGAYKITLLGGSVAGTFDDEIGALAEKLIADGEAANPVAVVLEKRDDGKVLIKAMKEILPPEELGGEPEATEAAEPENVTAPGDSVEDAFGPPVESLKEAFELARSLPSQVLAGEIAERLVKKLENQVRAKEDMLIYYRNLVAEQKAELRSRSARIAARLDGLDK